MGLMQKCLGVFGRRSEETRRSNESVAPSIEFEPVGFAEPKPAATTGTALAEPPLSTDVSNGMAEDPSLCEPASERTFMVEETPLPVPPPAPMQPLSRRELMDELQKNYREVVSLVRKVNTHLDRSETRSTTYVDVATRIESSIDGLAETLRAQTDQTLAIQRETSAEVLTRMQDLVREGHEGRLKIVEVLEDINLQIRERGDQQDQLVTTMAQFRETMNGIAITNQQTCRAIETIRDSSERREEQLLRLVQINSRMNLLVFAVSALLGMGAMGIALFVLITNG